MIFFYLFNEFVILKKDFSSGPSCRVLQEKFKILVVFQLEGQGPATFFEWVYL